jgi:cytochrome c oxidase assembly protein subunit 15
VWTLFGLSERKPLEVPVRIRAGAVALLVLVLVQIYLGALVAGLRAGLIYNTWPLMDGVLLPKPADLFFSTPWWRNLFENTLTVQFNHRMTAYVLWTVSLLHLLAVVRTVRRGPALTGAVALAGGITVQAALGILTLLYQVPIGLALLHQGVAMVVLTIAVAHVVNLRAAPMTEHAYRTAPPSPAS